MYKNEQQNVSDYLAEKMEEAEKIFDQAMNNFFTDKSFFSRHSLINSETVVRVKKSEMISTLRSVLLEKRVLVELKKLDPAMPVVGPRPFEELGRQAYQWKTAREMELIVLGKGMTPERRTAFINETKAASKFKEQAVNLENSIKEKGDLLIVALNKDLEQVPANTITESYGSILMEKIFGSKQKEQSAGVA
jgi:hypothetical protein